MPTYYREHVRMVDGRVLGMFLGLLVVENEGSGHSKVGTKRVNEHGAANVRSLQDMYVQGLVGGVEHDLKECHNDELKVADSSE